MTNSIGLLDYRSAQTDVGSLIAAWRTRMEGHGPESILAWAADQFPGRVALSSSLGLEDQVLTDMIGRHGCDISVFTLDTGRLFDESYQLIEQTEARYQLRIQMYFPDSTQVEQMTGRHGVNLFRTNPELRKLCCRIRKLEPLGRALSGLDAWITGLRRGQSITRDGVQLVEWDETNGMIKINPLAAWDEKRVWSYIREHHVPYNLLHDRGFPSIGCSCCTRAVAPGADPRSGRWWWELPEQRECGLHVRPRPPVPLERPESRSVSQGTPAPAAGGL